MKETKKQNRIFKRTVLSIMVAQPLRIRLVLSAAGKIVTNLDMLRPNKKRAFQIFQRSKNENSTTLEEQSLPVTTVEHLSIDETNAPSSSSENSSHHPLSLLKTAPKLNRQNVIERFMTQRILSQDESNNQTSTPLNVSSLQLLPDTALEQEQIEEDENIFSSNPVSVDTSSRRLNDKIASVGIASSKKLGSATSINKTTIKSANSSSDSSRLKKHATISIDRTTSLKNCENTITTDVEKSTKSSTSCDTTGGSKKLDTPTPANSTWLKKPSVTTLIGTKTGSKKLDSATSTDSARSKKPSPTSVNTTTSSERLSSSTVIETAVLKQPTTTNSINTGTSLKKLGRTTFTTKSSTTPSDKTASSSSLNGNPINATDTTKSATTIVPSDTATTSKKLFYNTNASIDETSPDKNCFDNVNRENFDHPKCLRWYNHIKDDEPCEELEPFSPTPSKCGACSQQYDKMNNENKEDKCMTSLRRRDPYVELYHYLKDSETSSVTGIFSWFRNKWDRNRVPSSGNHEILSPKIQNQKSKKIKLSRFKGGEKRSSSQATGRFIDKKTGAEYIIPVIKSAESPDMKVAGSDPCRRRLYKAFSRKPKLLERNRGSIARTKLYIVRSNDQTSLSPDKTRHRMWRENRAEVFRDQFIKRKIVTTTGSANDSWWKNFNSNMLPK